MRRSVIAWGILGSVAVAGASAVLARQNQPGFPTLAQVHILNRDRSEAIPIKVQNVGDSLPVVVADMPDVTLSRNTIVGTMSARQIWEYRRIVVPAATDATPALTAAGLEGWEVVHAMTVGTNGIWTLKRPK